jgi:hypothetical protein
MTKVKPNTKEQLIDYMLKYLSLGTYDKKFCTNLLHIHIAKNKPVTSNQSDLLDKIISRYNKQFAKQEIDSNQMIALNWTLPPIESLPQYTQAHVAIADADSNPLIVIHSPFKKTYVKEVRELDYAKWDRDERFWIAPATEKTIRALITLTEKHYESVTYCTEIENILTSLVQYESAKHWQPTLIKANNSFYIVAANKSLMEAIEHITLNDEPDNLARLVRMGIRIDESIITNDNLSFAVNRTPSLEQFNISTIIDYLLMIKADLVILAEWFGPNKDFILELANNLKANNIEHKLVKSKRSNELNIDLRKYQMPVKINLGIWKSENTLLFLGKNINLVNSNPVDIK